ADRNRSHWSTSKTPSYTKSVSWQHHPGTFGMRNGIITHYFCNMRRGSQFFSACELALQTSGSRLEYSYFSTCTNIRLTPD
ncbi:hypothetical protein NQU36_05495, partial [Escherichia coli]|uniref:hypothetical protein n=1 Tax=Escherichia coli TaxID=562 RepID=UPI002118C0A3